MGGTAVSAAMHVNKLSRHAQSVRSAGRAGDTILVHVNPEEFAQMRGAWGEESINPNTGLPEYGFFSKLKKLAKFDFRQIKKIGKGIIKDPRHLLFGIDPIGTKIGSKVTGKPLTPLVNEYGGPTDGAFDEYAARYGEDSLGFARPAHAVANAVAQYYGGKALSGVGGNLLGRAGQAIAPTASVGQQAANGVTQGFANGLGNATGAAAGSAAGAGSSIPGIAGAVGGIVSGAGNTVGSVSGAASGSAAGGGSMPGGLWDNIGEAIKIGGSLYNTYQQGEGAKDASRASQAGYQAGIDEQRRQFDIIMGMLEPQRNFGNAALGELSGVFGYNGAAGVATPNAGSSVGSTGIGINGAGGITQGVQAAPGAAGAAPATVGPPNFGAFFKSPDYQFRRDEGTRDIGNSFAARGGALSGNALRGITDFNSNLASGEFDNFIQRRLQAAGLGGAATSQGVNAANYTGANVANLLGNQGNARASGIVDRTNATTGGLNDISQWYGNFLRNRQIGVGG
jgi:hypothetical protein